jgi:hypothetical protein
LCEAPPSTLVITDQYNSPTSTAAPHIGYVGIINPATGVVIRGTRVIARTGGSPSGNTCKPKVIETDFNGKIYVGGVSAFKFEGRDVQMINGKLVGTYAGDMMYLNLSNDLMQRKFWGTFNAPNSAASGIVRGIGIRDNIISMVGESDKGNFTTTNGTTQTIQVGNQIVTCKKGAPFRATAYTPEESTLRDAYLAVWYENMGDFSKCDSLDEREQGPTPIECANNECNYEANFTANKRNICVGELTTFTNTSVGDSINQAWSFGTGASLLPGTIGAGSLAVSYSSAGTKTSLLM